MRGTALAGFAFVAVNLLWHGAQPYAVGAVPAPWDKLAHLVLFGGFSAAAWVMLGGARATADLLAPMVAVAVGVVDEVAQSYNPGRAVGLDDLAADAVGAVLAAVALALLRERMRTGRAASVARARAQPSS
jgi:VanZ family protein